jgi:hypothetical protein
MGNLTVQLSKFRTVESLIQTEIVRAMFASVSRDSPDAALTSQNAQLPAIGSRVHIIVA